MLPGEHVRMGQAMPGLVEQCPSVGKGQPTALALLNLFEETFSPVVLEAGDMVGHEGVLSLTLATGALPLCAIQP